MEQTIIAFGRWLFTRSDGDWVLIGACLVLAYCLVVLAINPALGRLHRNTWL